MGADGDAKKGAGVGIGEETEEEAGVGEAAEADKAKAKKVVTPKSPERVLPSPKKTLRRKVMGMCYEKPTASLLSLSAEMQGSRDDLFNERNLEKARDPGFSEDDDLEALRKLLKKRAGSVVAGWRADLDIRGRHSIGEADWFKVMRTIGFRGNACEAWRRCSRGKGLVTLADLDPASVHLLSEFFNAFKSEIGKLSDLFDDSDSMRVSKAKFIEKCEKLKKPSETSERTSAIDVAGVFASLRTVPGVLTAADFAWLDHYCEREDRPKKPASPSAPAKAAEATDVKPELTQQERLVLEAQKRQVRDFKVKLQHRYGSIMRAWRLFIDRDGAGSITAEDMEMAADALGLEDGAALELWDEIVGADAESMSLDDFYPEGQQLVEQFKKQCVVVYGSTVAAFQALEAAEKPLVTKDEFRIFCGSIRFDGNYKSLFEYLDDRGAGRILLASIDEKASTLVFGPKGHEEASSAYEQLDPLPLKAARIDLRTRAREQCGENKRNAEDARNYRQELLDVLTSRWQSPVRAWGCVFDRQGKGKLSKDEFFVGCSVAGYIGSKTKLWEELNIKPKQSVRLRDIAPEATQECANFKTLGGKQLTRLLAEIEVSQGPKAKKVGAKINDEEFKQLCTAVGYQGSPEGLMKHFDLNGTGIISSKSLRYFAEEKKEEKAMQTFLQKHQSHDAEKWRQKLADIRMAPSQEILVKQRGLLATGREKRASRREMHDLRKQLLSDLSRKFGSIVKAWKLALNPGDAQELGPDLFVDGLKRAGILEAAAKQQDVEKYNRLYQSLIQGDEEAFGLRLKHLDPKIDELIAEWKSRCVERYGSIWQAFDEFDPEATGKITKKQFIELCHEIKATDGVHRLLHHFDPEEEDEINLEDIDKDGADDARDACEERKEQVKAKQLHDEKAKRLHMLIEHKPPLSVMEARQEERRMKANRKLLEEVKVKLTQKYGNLVRAWTEALNPDGKKSIDFEDFETAIDEEALHVDAYDLWKALGLEVEEDEDEQKVGKGQLKLDMLEPNFSRDLAELHRRIEERYGSLVAAFSAIDPEGTMTIGHTEFHLFCHECQFRLNERRLWEFLTKAGEPLHLSAIDKKAAATHDEAKHPKRPKTRGTEGEDTDEGFIYGSQRPEDQEEEENEEEGEKPDPRAEAVREEILKRFREFVLRRFGNRARAWRAIDTEGRGVLCKQEFVKAIAKTGYAGGQSNLWNALVGEKTRLSLMEFDREGFDALVAFRRAVVGRYKTLQRPFEEFGQPTKKLGYEDFCKLCKRAGVPKPWDAVFLMLSANDTVTWNQVQWLEDWDWEHDGGPRPKRQSEPRELFRDTMGLPPRAVGEGALCTSMRPRKVVLPKSNSLPILSPQLRANWNDRHQILDHAGNKDEQTLHRLCQVECQDAERVRRRVAKKIAGMSTAQWIAEHIQKSSTDDSDDEAY